ncbi:hypothetical protein B0H17DRAFT_1326673 [Mycena rosella]|uniref:Uncharacterized protein n=1 Tax=Mycena rosella TaxID=1033263 RepID=A0AAD7GRU0_MYCRO|nr:hypothetical protein B0H17DRAFT_1326673 [Mycena rosella]
MPRSSHAHTPESDDDFNKVLDAMNQSSPITPSPPKRSHETMTQDDNETEDATNDNTANLHIIRPNQNISAVAKRYVERKRLRTDQAAEVDMFINDPVSAREVKMFVTMLALDNKLEKIVTAKAAYQVSPELNKNILNYAPAVLLSSKTTVYKGNGATDLLLAILKRYRFDMPPGIENIPADWAKISDIEASVKINKDDDNMAPPDKQQNIFDLTTAIVKGTKCTVNVVLCARVALMRSVYLKHPGVKFWDQVDERLVTIRAKADGDAKKVTKLFRQVLATDREKHGIENYKIEAETVDDFQQQVDDVIDAGIMNARSDFCSSRQQQRQQR